MKLQALLQKNVLDRKVWETRLEMRLAIVAWIEGKYHRKRRQRGLGKLTPVEFEVVIVHSDRGSQFRSKKFQKALKRHKLLGSMRRVGADGDNDAMGTGKQTGPCI